MKSQAVRFGLLVLLLAGLSIGSMGVGAVRIHPRQIIQSLLGQATGTVHNSHKSIVLKLRAPRILLAVLLGAGLGCAGAGFQGLFRNALADPFVIGASSGAALGATWAIIHHWRGQWLGIDAVSISALVGSLLVVALVYGIASSQRATPTIALLLAGIAVSSFVGALVSLLMFRNNEQLTEIFGWLMGSMSGRSWPAVRAASPLIGVGIISMWLMARPLDALAFGDDTAMSLGMDLRRMRAALVVAASLMTAAAVAAAGIIGFVGLIAPHMARLFMRTARHSAVLPASCLTGAILLLAADTAARTIVEPREMPVGVITALLGGPFFVYLLRTRHLDLQRS